MTIDNPMYLNLSSFILKTISETIYKITVTYRCATNESKYDKNKIISLTWNNKTISDKVQTVEEFNNHFGNIGNRLLNETVTERPKNNFKSY